MANWLAHTLASAILHKVRRRHIKQLKAAISGVKLGLNTNDTNY